MTDAEKRREHNEPKVGENVEITFRGAHEQSGERSGNEVMYLKIAFSDQITLTEFSPDKNVTKMVKQMDCLGSLLEALGLRMESIPYIFDWEVFVAKFIKFTQPCKGRRIYAKLTLDHNGYIKAGEGRCFSQYPDLIYTDNDRANLSNEPVAEANKFRGELP